MRHLSFALVVTLFFSHFVIALPTGSRQVEESISLTHAPPSRSLERRVLSRIVQALKGGSRRLASSKSGGNPPNPPLFGSGHPSVGSIRDVRVGDHVCFFVPAMIWPVLTLLQQTTDASGKPLSKKVQNMWHAAPVLGTKEPTHNANDPTLQLAPITHGGGKNPDFVPDKANKYVKGPDNDSKIHVGKPFEVPLSKTRPTKFKNWVVSNFQGLRNKVTKNVNKPAANQPGPGHQSSGGAAGKPGNSGGGAQRSRSSAPPNQGKKGSGRGGKA